MAHIATSQGKIRPNSTKLLNADGTESRVHWIREQTVIKRIRRALAKRNHSLRIHSEGSQARNELGEYVVLDDQHEVLSANCKLPELARFLGVLADDEMIEPPAEKGWFYHVARKHSEIIEGQKSVWLERASRDFRTERAARKALEGMEIRTGLVIIGDTSEESTEAMAKVWKRDQQARQAAALAEIESAIEANPTLRYLRSEAGSERAWGAAVAFDLELQRDPAWAGKPVADRLAEVVNRLADLGLVAVEDEVSV